MRDLMGSILLLVIILTHSTANSDITFSGNDDTFSGVGQLPPADGGGSFFSGDGQLPTANGGTDSFPTDGQRAQPPPATNTTSDPVIEAFTHTGFVVGSVSSFLTWYLIIRYKTENDYQSLTNLLTMMIAAIPTFLIPAIAMNGWDVFKLVAGIIATMSGIIGDGTVYQTPGHFWSIGLFFFLEVVGFCVVINNGDKYVRVTQLIQKGTSVGSVTVQLLSFFLCPTWEFVRYDSYNSFLGAIYILCGIPSSLRDLISLILIVVSATARIIYGILIISRLKNKGVSFMGWSAFCSGVENLDSRTIRSFSEISNDIWRSIKYLGKGFWGGIKYICENIRLFICFGKEITRLICIKWCAKLRGRSSQGY